jgi:hypothetical protein
LNPIEEGGNPKAGDCMIFPLLNRRKMPLKAFIEPHFPEGIIKKDQNLPKISKDFL